MVNPRELGAKEFLIAAPGAAVQKNPQRPVEWLNRR